MVRVDGIYVRMFLCIKDRVGVKEKLGISLMLSNAEHKAACSSAHPHCQIELEAGVADYRSE